MKRAIIYARVSTTRQADDGVSIDAQIEQCHKKAAEMGAAVLQVFRDDGITGTSALKRHAFQRAINFCAYNDVDYFIVWSTSRFARNKIDAASYKQILKESGTRLAYATMTIDSETDEGWFTDSIMEIIDEHVSRQISRDTKRSMLKNAEEGYFNGGRPPFGYQAISEGARRKLVPNEAETPLVLQIFRRFAGGESAIAIARSFNKSGYSQRGAEFQSASLSNMLKNHVYIGETIYNRTTKRMPNPPEEWIIKQTHQGIIPPDVFNAVQQRFSPRTLPPGNPTSNFMFSGLLRCGRCGKAMVIENATGRNKTYNYYNCSGFRKGFECKSRRIPAEKFDAYMLGIVVDKLLTQELATSFIEEAYRLHTEKNNEREGRLKIINDELKELRQRRGALLNVLETNGAEQVSSIVQRINQYDSREKGLLIELEKAAAEPEYPALPEEALKNAVGQLKAIILKTTDVKKLRIMLQSFVENIVVNDTNIEINYLPERIVSEKEMVHSSKGWHAHGDSNPGCRRERAVS